MAIETVRSSTPARTALIGLGAALAALAFLAVGASAQVKGTGQEIFQDPLADAGGGGSACSPCVPVYDVLRLGATSDPTALHFWVATDTYCKGPGAPAPCTSRDVGTPHKAVNAEYPSSNPAYLLKFQVGGGACYLINPSNNVNTNTWAGLIVYTSDCSPQSNLQAGSGPTSPTLSAEWVCNEAHFRIPFGLIGNPAPGATITMLAATSQSPTNFFDTMPIPNPPTTAAAWQYTLGSPGPDPNPRNLVAGYSAYPSPRVVLDWEAPLGGNLVTGYKIERRMVWPITTAWVQLASVGPSPDAGKYPAMGPYAPVAPATEIPTEYTEIPAPAPSGRYQYRVTALRCNNLGTPGDMPAGGCPPAWSAACTALAPFPGSTPAPGTPGCNSGSPCIYSQGVPLVNVPFYQGGPAYPITENGDTVLVGAYPSLKPDFHAVGPGERTNEQDRFTACVDPSISFFDLSTTRYLNLTEWTWDFGDGTPPVTIRRSDAGFTTQNVTHTFDQPGVYRVTLTVRDSQPVWPGLPLGVVQSQTNQVHSLGRPDCCPTLSPVQSWGIDEGDVVAFQLFSGDLDRKVATANLDNQAPPIPPFPPGSPNTGRIVVPAPLFTASDVGRQVTGAGIPAGAIIKVVQSPTTAFIAAPAPVNGFISAPLTAANGIAIRVGPAWSYSLASNPPLPPHSFDAATGVFKWTAGPGQAGLYQVQASVLQAEVPQPSPYTPPCGETHPFVIAVGSISRAVDSDMDGIADFVDDCPSLPDEHQLDADRDGQGDVCDRTPCGVVGGAKAVCATDPAPNPTTLRGAPDRDRDGVPDSMDNCAVAPNNNQRDTDNDMFGDVCDIDLDGDGVLNALDNCALAADRKQVDLDADGVGDVCPSEGGIQGASDVEPAQGNALTVGRESGAQLRSMGWGALAFALVAVAVLIVGAMLKKR